MFIKLQRSRFLVEKHGTYPTPEGAENRALLTSNERASIIQTLKIIASEYCQLLGHNCHLKNLSGVSVSKTLKGVAVPPLFKLKPPHYPLYFS